MLDNHALDEEWFSHLLKIRVKYDKFLAPDFISAQLIKNNYLSDKDLKFNYSLLKSNDFSVVIERINNLNVLINSDIATNKAAALLWKAKLVQLGNQINLLKKVQSLMISVPTPGLIESTQLYINEVVSTPDKKIFDLTLAELKVKLKIKESTSLLKTLKLDTAINNLGSYEELIKNFPFNKFDSVQLKFNERIDMPTLKLVLESELKKLSLDENWIVKIDYENKYKRVLVFYANKIIMLPGIKVDLLDGIDYKISYKKCLRLVSHEIMTHVLRSANGFNSKLKLLSVGLDSYAEVEEGLATFREQQALGMSTYFAGFNSYLAIGLAFGMDRENIKRTPLELFEILVSIYHTLYYKDINKAKYSALKRILRTYVSFDKAELINTRDLYYRSGNIKVHSFYSCNNMTEELINAGIYDPTNPLHVQGLKDLGVI